MTEMRTSWYCYRHGSVGIPGTHVCEMTQQPSYRESMMHEGLDPDDAHCQMVEADIRYERAASTSQGDTK